MGEVSRCVCYMFLFAAVPTGPAPGLRSNIVLPPRPRISFLVENAVMRCVNALHARKQGVRISFLVENAVIRCVNALHARQHGALLLPVCVAA